MKNYQITIGYRAVISVDIKSENESDAKRQALELFQNKERKKWYNSKGVELQDDRFNADGVVDMDETWNSLYKQ